jgi:hypothetical protein
MSAAEIPRGRLLSIESIAGWVFADLLLVLFLVGLGSAQPMAAVPDPPKPVVHEKKKPTIVGMRTEPRAVSITFNAARLLASGASRQAAERTVCQQVSRAVKGFRSDRAALVLIFGGAPDVSAGQEIARRIAPQLSCGNANVFTRGTPTRAFWDGTVPQGTARLEIFLFTTEAR